MEEEVKISFWKKLKISIFGLEEYQKLAGQKITKTIGYIAKLMLIFVFFLSIVLTYKFAKSVGNIEKYINSELADINFENNILKVTSKQDNNLPIKIEDENILNGKVIIDTSDLTEEQISSYEDEVKGYTNRIVILKDKIILNTGMMAVSSSIAYKDIANQYNIVKLDKQDITEMLTGKNALILYGTYFAIMYLYLYIIHLSTILLDAILYSFLAYITGAMSRLRFKYSATYNIAAHSLTLPIILNLIYMIINILTGYTIKYFDIMYIVITCIYIITSILLIRTDIIKRQMELSKIISEQEKVKAELERKEQEKKEEEERERVRKEDEKKRQEEKKKKEEENKKEEERKQRDGNTPQPEANIN